MKGAAGRSRYVDEQVRNLVEARSGKVMVSVLDDGRPIN
jgi:hypothetical protein